ncbi:tRNA pseudouridine(13) synthase TruD, partial [Candidatus Woesearchaeota archaeon]|nr:tRNA pseudouridine(13) synthase TruD [Candidatus Woesearchaeota archaeon]
MHKIKQIPQDFVVKEVIDLVFDDRGDYSFYLLKKTDYNTVDVIKRISRLWNIREKFFNFAGTKDKVAVTQQYISIKRGPEKDLELENIELKFLGKGNDRLYLGELEKNEFEIVVRNISKRPKTKLMFTNFFDSQRFGKNKNNHVVGKHIV